MDLPQIQQGRQVVFVDKKVSIELQNDLAELDRLTQWVEEFGEQYDLPFKIVMELNLVLEEVVANVISYAYEDQAQHILQVQMGWEGELLSIRVSDDGRPFDPLQLPPPDLEKSAEERSVGGLGIHFMRKLMAEIMYERSDGKNVLTMRRPRALPVEQIPAETA